MFSNHNFLSVNGILNIYLACIIQTSLPLRWYMVRSDQGFFATFGSLVSEAQHLLGFAVKASSDTSKGSYDKNDNKRSVVSSFWFSSAFDAFFSFIIFLTGSTVEFFFWFFFTF